MAAYLLGLYDEAARRGYRFDRGKIIAPVAFSPLTVTRGQVDYAWRHLKRKLRLRSPARYRALLKVDQPAPHPLFTVVAGEVEPWERL